MLQRILAPLVELREDEGITALLMFAYSFLAMAGYNVVKPATRSQFIDALGANNLPYVQLVAGLIMGFVIQAYTSAMRLLPRRWVFNTLSVTSKGARGCRTSSRHVCSIGGSSSPRLCCFPRSC